MPMLAGAALMKGLPSQLPWCCESGLELNWNIIPSLSERKVNLEISRSICHIFFYFIYIKMLCLVTQSCLTLGNPTDCSPPGSSVRGDSPGKNTGVSCHTLLQGIFPTRGSNPGLPHCRWILYCLSHQGRSININNYVFVLLFLWFFFTCKILWRARGLDFIQILYLYRETQFYKPILLLAYEDRLILG